MSDANRKFTVSLWYAVRHPVNKQINDKERIAAAMENPNLRTLVEDCIKDED